jgi:hypothetical protein
MLHRSFVPYVFNGNHLLNKSECVPVAIRVMVFYFVSFPHTKSQSGLRIIFVF